MGFWRGVVLFDATPLYANNGFWHRIILCRFSAGLFLHGVKTLESPGQISVRYYMDTETLHLIISYFRGKWNSVLPVLKSVQRWKSMEINSVLTTTRSFMQLKQSLPFLKHLELLTLHFNCLFFFASDVTFEKAALK